MITVSFSGLMVVGLILIPNICFAFFQPKDVPEDILKENKILNVLEKIGQIGCLIFLIFDVGNFTFGFKTVSLGLIWMVSSLILIILYYLLWIRYYAKGRKYRYLYDRVIIPVPMAIIPAFLFLLTGVLGQHFLLVLLSIFFAMGHISISWSHYRQLKRSSL